MNILLATELYPEYENQSRTSMSYALHDFAKQWNKENNLVVLRINLITLRTIIFLNKNLLKINSYSIDGVKIFNINIFKIPKTDIFYGNIYIKKLLCKIKFYPDIIFAHISSSFYTACNLTKYYKCRLVLGIHNCDLKNNNYKRKYFKKALSVCNKIACRSKSIKNKLAGMFPLYDQKYFIANSGIDESDIENNKFFEKKIKDIENKDKLIFITVANLIKRKNIDIVLQTLSKFNNYCFEYIIIGDGPEKDYLKNEKDRLKLNKNVTFLGNKTREEVLSYLKISDVFILVSVRETFGLVYLEAMAKCNIVIGNKNWGIDGIVINGNNGFLADIEDHESLISILKNIFSMSFEEKKNILIETQKTILENSSIIAAKKYLDSIY